MVAWMAIMMALKGMMGGKGKGGDDDDFEGSGLGGFDFEEKGYQERNANNLQEILSSKKSTDAIENLSKIKPEAWAQLAESTQQIIDMAGRLDPGVIDQLTSTIKEYVGSRFDAIIADFLAPYMPAILGVLNDYIFPAIDWIMDWPIQGIFNSIETFFNEIFTGFPRITQALDQIIWQNQQALLAAERARKQAWYDEIFFPEMDQLYADHPESFIGDADIIAEQADLRPNRPGQMPGGSQGAVGVPAPGNVSRWDRLEDI